MIVQCPHCGKLVVINGLGRKRLNIPLKNVCESLQAHRNVAAAANELNCSQGYIFGALKANGLKLKDVINKHHNIIEHGSVSENEYENINYSQNS
jgi:hypothetical protein